MTIEIPQNRWKPFCEKLNAQCQALLDIRLQGDDLRLVAQAALLRSLNFYEGDAGNNSLVIEFGAADKPPAQHCVIEPIHFILRRESGGAHYHLLEIPSETGTTVIIFHPGISPALLSELEIPLPA